MVPRRPLGSTGLTIAPLVLGGNVFGWTADERRSFEILDAFVSAGFNAIDTADVYSNWVSGHEGGESEAILGRWLARSGRREEVVIATKVGMETATGARGLSRAHIAKAIDGSLRRLGTDYIDLYQAHEDDPSTPLEETLTVFNELLEEGRIHALGASNYSAARLNEAARVSRATGLRAYGTLQPRYNLYDRAIYEDELADTCRALGLGVLPYASLASGFLSGKYRSAGNPGTSPRAARALERLTERGLRILDALDSVSRAHATSPASVAIAWLLTRPTVTAPIASATSPAQLNQLLEGTTLHLSPGDLDLLGSASS